jgi:Tfp pilus assembly protein PilN
MMKLLLPGAYQRKKIGNNQFSCFAKSVSALNDEQITREIVDFLKKEKTKLKSAILCLPRNLVTVRNLYLPSQDAKEIDQMVELHISRVVPHKKDEIIFSHHFLGVNQEGYARVMLAIIQKSLLRKQVKILESAGLSIERIGLSSYCGWQWVAKNYQAKMNGQDTYILVEVDDNFSDFIIFSQQNILFTCVINIGAASIKADPANGLNKFLGEIKQSIVVFNNEESYSKPSKVFIGGAGLVSDIIGGVESGVDLPVELVLPPYDIGDQKTKETFNLVSVNSLAGSAYKDTGQTLSFTLPEMEIRKSVRNRMKELVIMGVLFLYMLTVICVMFLGDLQNRQMYLDHLLRQYQRIEGDAAGLAKQQEKQDFIIQGLKKRQVPFLVFYQLSRIIPTEANLNFINIDKNNSITLRGQSLDFSDVFKFISELEQAAYFKDIQTKYTRKKRWRNKEVTEFELTLQVVHGAD